jgi:hypothetical protein
MSTIIDGTAGITFPSGSGTQAAQSKVLQVVNATYSTQVSTATSTFVDTGLTASITPLFSTSKILILVTQSIRKSAGNLNNNMHLKVLRNSTDLGYIGYGLLYTGTAIDFYSSASGNVLDSPATTSAITYKTQFSSPSNTSAVYCQSDNAGVSYITLMEIAA